MPKADGPFFGEMLEEEMAREYDLEVYRQDYYDLRERDQPDGEKSEVKGAAVTVKNPKGTRAGRFQLQYSQHIKLTNRGDYYIFGLYDPTASEPVQAHKRVKATEVTQLVSDYSWRDSDGEKKVPWYVIFPDLKDDLLGESWNS